jgi:3-hydroxymyristoyl/3-hydroxydecanoyl-(acyl carrier protein) dehydratase
LFTREDALEFAVGSVSKVFGEEFREADNFPSRVRLPDEPLMLVDRVLSIEGVPKSLSPGSITTEIDVKEDGFYLDQGRMSPGVSIESGQADLMLSSYLGADFQTRGLSYYRLLDAEVTFLREPPSPGETARYDVRILKFFRHLDASMFRFEFDGSVGGSPLLIMRKGCAGFFSKEALLSGKGLTASAPKPGGEAFIDMAAIPYKPAGDSYPKSLSEKDTEYIRNGDLSPLGETLAALSFPNGNPITLPSGKLSLIDSVPIINRRGGAYGGGFIRAAARIKPEDWFLTCHFKGDKVMPGTLMYDASLQALRLYLLSLGWIGEEGEKTAFLPSVGTPASLKCRGQVTPKVKSVAYDVHVKEISFRMREKESSQFKKPGRPPKTPPSPFALADAVMWADGKPIAEVKDMSLSLRGASEEYFSALFGLKRVKGRLSDSKRARKEDSFKAADAASLGEERGAGRSSEKSFEKDLGDSGPLGAAAPKGRPEVASPSPGALGPGKWRFTKSKVKSVLSGKLSSVLGPKFLRFDEGKDFVARLPKAPYDFLDTARVTEGSLGEVVIGSEIRATREIRKGEWVFSDAGFRSPLPYAALNEIALQPCGFLATFMGSAIPFQEPMHFRNLGGEAVVLREVLEPLGDIPILMETAARLSKSSVLGAMTIQHYDFKVFSDGVLAYEGKTHFGFLSPENLARQKGLKIPQAAIKELTLPQKLRSRAFPTGFSWPRGKWRMLDKLYWDERIAPKDLREIWGAASVNPGAWFFKAHFPEDPVWPGSLGLEAFLEAAKVLAALILYPDISLKTIKLGFSSPLPGIPHKWLYRGQILPASGETVIGLKVTNIDFAEKLLVFKGLLFLDGLPIYELEDFSVCVREEEE